MTISRFGGRVVPKRGLERSVRLNGAPNGLKVGRRLVLALALALLTALLPVPGQARTKPTLVTTIAMLGEPLSRIAGERLEVVSLMGEGVDPHLYRPTRSDMVKLTRADIIIWTGLNLEAQMEDAMHRLEAVKPVVAVGETLGAADLIPWEDKGSDPHIWMDPAIWRAALGAAVDALVAFDPEGEIAYRTAAASYFDRMIAVERYAAEVIATVPEDRRVLITAHDAFGYFGRRFGIEVLGIQGISTESEAGLAAVEALVDTLVRRGVPAVFVETSVSDRNVRALIEGAASRDHAVRIGGSLYSDAMGAPGTYEGTYIGMIDHNATTIARALGGSAPERGMTGELTNAH
jgi:manganese/zinc/iron transport system substrate-binding protein